MFAEHGDGHKVYVSKGAAIKGYDPVAYFTIGAPTKGFKTITAEYNGATWQFSSEENKKLFIAHPEKYALQYGGYCAYALAVKGDLVKNTFITSTMGVSYKLKLGKAI